MKSSSKFSQRRENDCNLRPFNAQRQQHAGTAASAGSNGRRNNLELLVPSLPARLFILSEICHVSSRPQRDTH